MSLQTPWGSGGGPPNPEHICPVHVPSDTLWTWKWSPAPKMLSSINSSSIKRNGFERNPSNQNSTSVLSWFASVYKNIKWSHGQYAHSGIRVRPKRRKNDKFEKWIISVKNSSLDCNADFRKKSLVGVWRLILSRYDIRLHIYHIILNVRYKKNEIF